MRSAIKRLISRVIFPDLKSESISRALDLVANYDKLADLKASLITRFGPFSFDALRLSPSQLLMLFKEIDEFDNYCLDLIPQDNSVVVDVGTHIGVLPFIANNKLTNSRIFAVEPDRDNMLIARNNLESAFLRGTNQLTLLANAIAPSPGTLDFFVSNKVDWRSTLLINDKFLETKSIDEAELSSSYQVDCITLADLFAKINASRIDLLKITIAGSIEFDVLQASICQLEKVNITFIGLVVYPDNEDKVISLLNSLRFKLLSRPRSQSLMLFQKEPD